MNQKIKTGLKRKSVKRGRKRSETLFEKWQKGTLTLKQYEERQKREQREE